MGYLLQNNRPKNHNLTDHKNLEYWKTICDLNLRQARWGERLANYDFIIKYQPGKLAGKPNILSRESGDSRWEGDMKHRQNHGRVLLPEENFETLQALQVNTTETMKLQIDKELLSEIRLQSAKDKEVREILGKKASGNTRDGKIARGLCEEKEGVLIYDCLIWIPDNDELRLRILRDHHDAQARDIRGEQGPWNLLAKLSTGHNNANTFNGTWTTVTPAAASS